MMEEMMERARAMMASRRVKRVDGVSTHRLNTARSAFMNAMLMQDVFDSPDPLIPKFGDCVSPDRTGVMDNVVEDQVTIPDALSAPTVNAVVVPENLEPVVELCGDVSNSMMVELTDQQAILKPVEMLGLEIHVRLCTTQSELEQTFAWMRSGAPRVGVALFAEMAKLTIPPDIFVMTSNREGIGVVVFALRDAVDLVRSSLLRETLDCSVLGFKLLMHGKYEWFVERDVPFWPTLARRLDGVCSLDFDLGVFDDVSLQLRRFLVLISPEVPVVVSFVREVVVSETILTVVNL